MPGSEILRARLDDQPAESLHVGLIVFRLLVQRKSFQTIVTVKTGNNQWIDIPDFGESEYAPSPDEVGHASVCH